MENKLKKLYNYLVDNNYTEDASRIEVILDEYLQNNELSDLSKKRLSAMCNPRYLGNLYIKKLSDPYKWWNFLAEIKKNI
ncbi:hypothetical protein [Ruminococcus intestinalis]|uniref:hypothetical protein n=1 Tax=Ruminococcus intestinalis TaxID=2763066 RepID=UPI003F809562